MAVADQKHGFKDNNILAPALNFAAITKDDTTDFSGFLTRGIYVGGAGDLVAVDKDNNPVTFSSVPAGTILPIRARRVNSTSTTATNMVALY
jgi:hypothetical protein